MQSSPCMDNTRGKDERGGEHRFRGLGPNTIKNPAYLEHGSGGLRIW